MPIDAPSLGLTWAEAGLTPDDLKRAQEAVGPMAERLGLAAKTAPQQPHVWSDAAASRPTLFLDDFSAIPFLVNIAGVEEYQHRARVRAGDGDLFAAVTPATIGYERYCQEQLQMGAPELLIAEPVGGPMEVALACGEGPSFRRLVERAREAGGLAIHPYMGIASVWDLAAKIAKEAGTPVSVLAPPPDVTWIANDKGLLSETVTRVLGERWVVETKAGGCARSLADALLELASRAHRVGLKRTRCASGMGNAHWCAQELTRQADVLEARVSDFLHKTEWDGEEEVLVVAWEETDLSPSTQMWIPAQQDGPPILDGVYEQLLEGEERVFLGSRPSGLPHRLEMELARSSLLISAAFQQLGYVGRCSFDTLVLGDPEGDFRILYTECNGRWGGTSTPMHLVDRLAGRPRPPYRAQDFMREGLRGANLDDVLAQVGADLYDPRTGEGTFIFYNAGPLADSGKLDVIAIGRTQAEAEEACEVRLPKLLGV